MSAPTCLVHGACLEDLSSLLLFDRIVHPTIQAYTRPRNMPVGYAGYPVRDTLPESVIERLRAASLLVSPSDLIWSAPASAPAAAAGSLDSITQMLHSSAMQAVQTVMRESLQVLHTPAGDDKAAGWLRDIDRAGRTVAEVLRQCGYRTSFRAFAAAVTGVVKPGWAPALAVVLPQFPFIDLRPERFDAVLAFLCDATTARLRRELMDAITVLTQGDAGERIESLRKTCEDYAQWMFASGLPWSRGSVELLCSAGAADIALLVSSAADSPHPLWALHPRGVTHDEAARMPADAPFALVTQRRRPYPRAERPAIIGSDNGAILGAGS